METLTPERKLLIEKCIKSNRKFQNNEDLYDDFFNETYKNALSLLNAVSSETTIELYLKRVVTSSMINVLKDAGRLRRTSQGYQATPSVSIESIIDSYNPEYLNTRIIFKNIQFEDNPEDAFIKRELLKSITRILNEIEKSEPDKQYLTLFKLRYEDGLTQNEISLQLGISQSEVSKRLFKLMSKVKENLNLG